MCVCVSFRKGGRSVLSFPFSGPFFSIFDFVRTPYERMIYVCVSNFACFERRGRSLAVQDIHTASEAANRSWSFESAGKTLVGMEYSHLFKYRRVEFSFRNSVPLDNHSLLT